MKSQSNLTWNKVNKTYGYKLQLYTFGCGEIGRIENREEINGEKNDFMGVWLERNGGWKIDKTQVFSPLVHHNFISLILGEKYFQSITELPLLLSHGLAIAISLSFFLS